MAARQRPIPEPDFADSTDLRRYCNDFRAAVHIAAMLAHQGAAEMEAALSTIVPTDGKPFSRSRARRRARRVSRHMRHAAECMVEAGAAAVRTWGSFRSEYAPELSPLNRKRKSFKVVDE